MPDQSETYEHYHAATLQYTLFCRTNDFEPSAPFAPSLAVVAGFFCPCTPRWLCQVVAVLFVGVGYLFVWWYCPAEEPLHVKTEVRFVRYTSEAREASTSFGAVAETGRIYTPVRPLFLTDFEGVD